MESKSICTSEQAGVLQRWGALLASVHDQTAIIDARHAVSILPGGHDFEVKARGKFQEVERAGTPKATKEQQEFIDKLEWTPWSTLVVQ
jgi:hypothetical protein